ncbi:MAG: fused MFS/spermidine synthase [Candidatus Edwardsbacteria bacterium]|jgi:spermidine synthase|nr:fused MFS/spermidine synthase [Candidatus Edwardsbacteria bacterium]
MIAPRARSAVLLAALFLASFSALACEVSWSRMLGLALGGTVVSATVVLTAWMAGLAAGGFIWGRLADRKVRPGKLFAFTQLCAVAGIFYAGYFFSNDNPTQSTVVRYGVFAWIVASYAFAIGGAYPIIARALVKEDTGIGRGVGALAAVDALGGAAGGLVTGFVLLGTLGQNATLLVAAGLTLLAAALTWVLPAVPVPIPAPEKTAQQHVTQDTISARFIMSAAALTGLAGMSLQVAWIRALKIFLPNTSYSFGLVAGVLILGLAGGSWVFQLLTGRIRRPLAWLAVVQSVAGGFVLLSSFLLARLPALVLFPLADALSAPWPRIFLPPVALALALAFVPALCSGFTFPLLCAMRARTLDGLGTGVGLVRMANAAGSVAGPALAAFLLLPLLGVAKTVQAAGLVSLGVALGAAWSGPAAARTRAAVTALAAAGAVLLLATARPQLLPPSFSQSGRRQTRVIHYRETAEGTVTVSEDARTGIRACHVNNSAVVGTTYDAIKVVKLLGHLPFLAGSDARDVLVVGFGTGVTAATIAAHPGVRRIDCVEIAPGVREAARYFTEYNRGVALSPAVSFIADDGRAFLARTPRTYDMISADPTHPTLGCAGLYTVEYFRLCRSRLRPGGSICQYLPLHGLTPRMLAGIVAGFRSVFPHATVWLGHSHCVLLGSPAPLAVDFAALAGRLRALDDPLFHKDPYSLAACLLLDEAGAAALAEGAVPCTDDRNYLEFFDPAAKDPANWERNIAMLTERPADLGRVFAGAGPAALARYLAGRAAFIAGQVRQNRGDRRGALAGFRDAVAVNPENEEYRFLLSQEEPQAR